ncbi:MAG: phage portal protein [Acidobacteriia bacterium]|nr:phage portal protein [Terriglobia bacterium]
MPSSSLAVLSRDWRYPVAETRSSLENPQTPLSYPAEWLLDIFNGGRTDSGIRVSELTAFQVSTFLSGVDLIAGKISSLPIQLYERVPALKGRRVAHRMAFDHESYDLIALEPNDEMSAQTLLKAFLCHCLAWGNGYEEIQRDAGNAPVALWPRNPGQTRPKRALQTFWVDPAPWRPFPVQIPMGRMYYETTDGMEEVGRSAVSRRVIPLEDMLHVPGLALDGRLGQSTVWLARQTLGLALATEKFGAKYFANFAKPGGVLEMPVGMMPGDPRYEKARASWAEAQGGENAHRVAVMPAGFKFTPMSNNAQESQTVEQRVFIRTEIASLLHLPVRLVGDTSKGSKASTEQENQELLDLALEPWLNAIRQEWKRKLFPNRGIGRTPRSRMFVDFDVSGFIRGDAQSREKFNASGSQWSYLCPNDIRAIEKLNPIEEEWAEEFRMPVNMTLVTTPVDPSQQNPGGEQPAAGKPFGGARAYLGLFRDALGRVLRREKRDLAAFRGCFGAVLYALRDQFVDEAASGLGLEAPAQGESNQFVEQYIGGLAKRGAGWTAEQAGAVATDELGRAIREIRACCWREAGEARARQGEAAATGGDE